MECGALNGSGVSFLHRNRKKKKRSNPGGGVSIAYRKSLINFKEYKIKRKNYEILCVRGKIINNTTPLFVIAVYIPPKSIAARSAECLSLVNEAILKIKLDVKEAYILVAGDLNKRNIHDAIGDYSDFNVLATPPS